MKQIIIILILAAVAVFGFFAYKSFQTSAKDLSSLNKEDVRGFIDSGVNKAKEEVIEVKDQAIENAKQKAADELKNQVDETLGTK